ncbi:hypothetical protein [Millisia brevis]|uniref:hypothetical protein n=1 Tax=Millisia brevis TaxID=264148 RepID=UPI0008318717|nr:hypothetical protein [Millisia brevis]
MPEWGPAVGYLAVVVLTLVGTGIAWAVLYGSAVPWGRRPALAPVEFGMLTSDRLAVLVALTELAAHDAIVVRAGRVHATGSRAQQWTHPFVNDVGRAVAAGGGRPPAEAETATVGPRGALRDDLIERGYLRRPASGWVTVAPLVVGALGAIGIATGVLSAAAFAPVLICAVTGAALIVPVLHSNPYDRVRSGPTPRGVGELRRARERYRHLGPHHRPAPTVHEPRETAMGAAIYGPEAVRDSEPALHEAFRDIRIRTAPRTFASWGAAVEMWATDLRKGRVS